MPRLFHAKSVHAESVKSSLVKSSRCWIIGDRAIEEYVEDFCNLCHLVKFNDVALKGIFCNGLTDSLYDQMPDYKCSTTLQEYIDFTLLLAGSPFTVGIADEECNPTVPTTPNLAYIMSATSKPAHVTPFAPKPAHVTPFAPKPAHAMSATRVIPAHAMPAAPGPAHTMPAAPESAPVMAEPVHKMAAIPKPVHKMAAIPEPVHKMTDIKS
ncbi:hypothetical protein M9458_015277, partial [Cirrhinus mrigala]